jgi:hypothetical protein
MSQLKSHQLIYRQHERDHIASEIARADMILKVLEDTNEPEHAEEQTKHEEHYKAQKRRLLEPLLPMLDKRIARLQGQQ